MQCCHRRGCRETTRLSRAGHRDVCAECKRDFVESMDGDTLPRVEMVRRLDEFLQTHKPEPEISAYDLFDDSDSD
jgi:hypothetical protein